MKKIIDTMEAPAAVGAYSQAVKAGELVFTSGQLPIDPATGTFSDDVKEQAAQSMKNVGAIVKAAGGDYADIVKTTVLLADIADLQRSTKYMRASLTADIRPDRVSRSQLCQREPRWK